MQRLAPGPIHQGRRCISEKAAGENLTGLASVGEYRRDIDGLRAIAICSVVVFHASPRWLPGGFIGVDIFFVISGFLISQIILRENAAGSFTYRNFYARRIRRIFPALILVLLVSTGFGWWILLEDEFQHLGKQVLGSALFFANFSFWKEAGYFDTAVETKPLLHLWSLAVEEQFYLVSPLLLTWFQHRSHMLKWLAAFVLASFSISVYWAFRSQSAAFYLPFGRCWEIAAGTALAVLAHRGWLSKIPTGVRGPLNFLGVLSLGLGLVMIDRDRAFPGYWAVLPVFGTSLCIAAGPSAWVNRVFLSWRGLVGIGLISYPLYLWHWPLLAYARVLQDGFGDPPRSWRATAVALAALLAWLTYRFVEQPLRRKQGRRIVVLLACGMGLMATSGAAIWEGRILPRSNDPAIQGIISAGSDWVFPDALQAFQAGGQSFEIIPGGSQQVLLIGDSHIEQYRARAMQLAEDAPDHIATVLFATRGACPPIPRFMEPRDPECEERRAAGFQLAQRPEVKAVVLAGCWACYFDIGDATSLPTANSPPPPDRFYYVDRAGEKHYLRGGDGVSRSLDALADTIQTLKSMGKRVYLVLNIPVGGEYEPRVRLAVKRGTTIKVPLMDARPDDRAVSRKLALGRLGQIGVLPVSPTVALSDSQKALHARLERLALDNGAIPLDPQSVLCHGEDSQCLRTEEAGNPIYKDGSHLRAQYVRNHATFIDPALLIDDAGDR